MRLLGRTLSAIGFGAMMIGLSMPSKTPPPLPTRAAYRPTAKEKRAFRDRYGAPPRHKHQREIARIQRQIRAGRHSPVFSAADPKLRVV